MDKLLEEWFKILDKTDTKVDIFCFTPLFRVSKILYRYRIDEGKKISLIYRCQHEKQI